MNYISDGAEDIRFLISGIVFYSFSLSFPPLSVIVIIWIFFSLKDVNVDSVDGCYLVYVLFVFSLLNGSKQLLTLSFLC